LLRNFYSVVVAAMHRSIDAARIPAKDPLRKVRRLLDTNASVTERADILLEQLVIGGVVQVDIEVIGEKKLHQTKRVLVTGLLSHARFAVLLIQLVIVRSEVARAHFRKDFLCSNVRRLVPVWPEYDRLHHVGENRSGLVLVVLPDNHLHVERLLSLIVRGKP